MNYNTSFNDTEYSFDNAIMILSNLKKLGFSPYAFRTIGMFNEDSIYIIVNDNNTIEKRIVDYAYNTEGLLTSNDVFAKYLIEVCVQLFGHPHHSEVGDLTNEANYIKEIDISPEFTELYGDSVYSKIDWNNFEPGKYQVNLRNTKTECNCYGGILEVSIDETGNKTGYISKDK